VLAPPRAQIDAPHHHDVPLFERPTRKHLKFLDPFAGKECGSEKGLLEMGLRSVYYAELRGEKAAIKKMESQGSKEFLAELKVLSHGHHLNLVYLIGYYVEGPLFQCMSTSRMTT
jgi:hypothetical protein